MEPFPSDWKQIAVRPEGDVVATTSPHSGVGQPRTRLVLLAGLAAAFVVAVLMLWSMTPAPQLVIAGGTSLADTTPADGADSEELQPGSVAIAPSHAPLIVDVAGAVALPGLYELPSGSRIGDAVARAGGFSAQVDANAVAHGLNLAEPLSDGMKVYIPRLGDTSTRSTSPSGSDGAPTTGGLIDINTADAAALDTLPGVGPATAAKIIAAREQAPFTTIDELLSRKVVGPSTLEAFRPLVTIGR